jgi:tetratricopeptide (TPR) repeat protein
MMKKLLFVFGLFAGFAGMLAAQARSAHYEVIVPEGSSADAYSAEMELRFEAFNKIFCFNPALLSAPLRVRIFTNKGEYDNYVTSKLGSTRPGAVYLHYNNPAGRELVILQGSAEEGTGDPHQAGVQFLRAFVPGAPAWIREGFAVYFTTLVFNREKNVLDYEENLSWLETVKKSALSPEAVLQADTGGIPANFQAYAWSLVSFFLADSGGGYYRSLTDAFTFLVPGGSAEDNSWAVYNRLTLFTPISALTRDYNVYIISKKTFTELIDEGQKAYGAKNYAGAAELFRKAAVLRPGHYAPPYYLGLLAYEEKNYAEAEGFYKTALGYGAERALVQYARGVNAAASGKKAEAVAFLEEASAADPAKYKARSDDLIKKLQ